MKYIIITIKLLFSISISYNGHKSLSASLPLTSYNNGTMAVPQPLADMLQNCAITQLITCDTAEE